MAAALPSFIRVGAEPRRSRERLFLLGRHDERQNRMSETR
jgi:hypothetical protein